MWRFATCLLGALALAPSALAFPPRRVVTVDPLRGTIDGLRLGVAGTAIASRWGDPTFVSGGSGGASFGWVGPGGESAGAVFCDAPERRVAQLSYSGPFVTTSGDRPGTPVRMLRRHWPGSFVSGSLVRIGHVAFRLDSSRRLTTSVILGPAPPSLAGVLPRVCN